MQMKVAAVHAARQPGAGSAVEDEPPDVTVIDRLQRWARTRPQAAAFTFLGASGQEEESQSFGELWSNVNALASQLAACHAPGSHVVLAYVSGLPFIETFLACQLARLVPIPASAPLHQQAASRLIGIVTHSGATTVLTESALAKRLRESFADSACKVRVIDAQSAAGHAGAKQPRPAADDIALIQYTSGSTGTPRGAVIAHRALMHNQQVIERCFGHGEASVFVGALPLFHDMGLIGTVLQPIYLGVHSVLITPATLMRRPSRWLAAITRYRATTSGGPNSFYDVCVDRIRAQDLAGLDLSSWVIAFNGSEPVSERTMARFVRRFAPFGFNAAAMMPCYGLAEATLLVAGGPAGRGRVTRRLDAAALSLHQAEAAGDEGVTYVSSGRIAEPESVSIVDPESGAILSPGHIGEICVASKSVASGYWNDADATRAVFAPAHRLGITRVRTGDLGFVDAGGELFITGRLKDVLIVRGQNLYPQDLEEAAVQASARVRRAVAFQSPAAPNQIMLIAEVSRSLTAHNAPRDLSRLAAQIRTAIFRQLGASAHIVGFVASGQLPRTTSGKLCRNATAAAWSAGTLKALIPEAPAVRRSEANRLAIDAVLATLLELPVSELSAALPLVSQGVDSLQAATLAGQLERRGFECPLDVLLSAETLEEIAAATQPVFTSELSVETAPETTLPLHAWQIPFWFAQRARPGSAANNLRLAVSFPGRVVIDELTESLRDVVRRHEALRSRVTEQASGQPVQHFAELDDAAHTVIDATEWSRAKVERHIENRANTAFEFDGTLFRSDIVVTRDETLLVLVAHHIVGDLQSMSIVLREIARSYVARSAGRRCSLNPAPSLRTFLQTQKHAQLAARPTGLAHWKSALAGEIEALQLPRDAPETRRQSEAAARIVFEICADELAALRRVCAQARTTLHAGLLAVYRILLYRYTGQSDILIATPLGRRRAATQGLVACMTNPVPIRIPVCGRSTFSAILAETRVAMLGALRHGDLALHEIIREAPAARSPDGTPLIQTLMVYQNGAEVEDAAPLLIGDAGGSFKVDGLELRCHPLPRFQIPLELMLAFTAARGRLWGCLDYRVERFAGQTAAQIARHFQSLLRELVAAPERAIAGVELLDEGDRSTLAARERADQHLGAARVRIDALLEDKSRRTPDAIAVRWLGQGVSYRALNERGAQIAACLAQLGVGEDDRVALAMRPSAEWVAALFGIWKAGASVVPLDARAPLLRINDMLREAGAALVIHDESVGDELREVCARRLPWTHFESHAVPTASAVRRLGSGSSEAYVAFTSGSTGTPKGVMVSHEAVCNFALAQRARLGIRAVRRVLQLAPPSFDAAFSDVLMALSAGGTLCIPPPGARLPGAELSAFMRDEAITLLTATPSMLTVMEPSEYPDLSAVISMGEVCTSELSRRWSRHCAFFNGYGPTETTIGATLGEWRNAFAVDTRSGNPGLGDPFANYELYVLDSDLNRLPIGCVGEIYIGGSGVSQGYVGHPELTAERFLPNPYRGAGQRMYRSGDLARRTQAGQLEFIGRSDRQIKVRGVRIEPADIEKAIRESPQVEDCVVDAVTDEQGVQSLKAYIVAPALASLGSLRAFLKDRLPGPMVPADIVRVSAIPLGATGKIQLAGLSALQLAEPAADSTDDACDQIQRQLHRAWLEILRLPAAGIDENFFDLGGHSLLLSRLQTSIQEHTGEFVPLLAFFDHPTIRSLALHLTQRRTPCSVEAPARSLPARQICERFLPERSAQRPPIAVIGMAGRFPGANDLNAFWKNVLAGRESITFFSQQELAAAGIEVAEGFVAARGIIDDIELFDAAFFGFTLREAQFLDPQKRLLLELAQATLDDAAYSPSEPGKPNGIGVFVGSSRSHFRELAIARRPDLAESLGELKVALATDPSFLATLLAYKFNLTGPCMSLDTACSTSLVAVHQACISLWAGECTMALAGGASIEVPLEGGHRFEAGSIASPDGHCRAFDVRAAGTCRGMGGGLVLLKPLDAALRDGDHVHVVIRGSAVNNDGSHRIGFTAPSAEGQAGVIRQALSVAGVPAQSIGYIEAHGTGTALGDPIEVAGLNAALDGAAVGSVAIGSVKCNIGHLDSAAGIAGLIKCSLAVSAGIIPPLANLDEPNPRIPWDRGPLYAPRNARAWPSTRGPRRAGVSSFGMGGTNAHVVLEQGPAPMRDAPPAIALVPVSAGSEAALKNTVAQLAQALASRDVNVADAARTLATGRRMLRWRAAFVAADRDELLDRMTEGCWQSTRAVEQAPKIVLVLPECAPASWQDIQEMAQRFPTFRQALKSCGCVLSQASGHDFDSLLRGGSRGALAEPDVLSAAMVFCAEYALCSLMAQAGIRPSCLVASGVGELVASCVSGRLSVETALRRCLDGAGASHRLDERAQPHHLGYGRSDPDDSLERADFFGQVAVIAVAGGFVEELARAVRTEEGAGALIIEATPVQWVIPQLRSAATLDPSRLYSLLPREGGASGPRHALETFGRLWRAGVPVEFAALTPPGRRISLPGVTLDRTRVWIDASPSENRPVVQAAPELPAPAAGALAGEVSATPQCETRVERELAMVWRSLLGVAKVKGEDDFFTLGGDSLLAVRLARLLSERLGAEVDVDLIFDHPTYLTYCAALGRLVPGDVEPLALAAGKVPVSSEHHPLSREQTSLWLASHAENAGAALNLAARLDFEGSVERHLLQEALRSVLERHALLLNNFVPGEEQPLQWRAHQAREFALKTACVAEPEVDTWAQRAAAQPFDTASDWLIRATLLNETAGRPQLILVVHHLVADGWSLLVLLRDVAACYGVGVPMQPAVRASYADYVAFQRIEADPRHLAYWRESLKNLPLVELPPDYTMASPASGESAFYSLSLGEALTMQLRRAIRREGVTAFVFYATALQILLRRYLLSEDVVMASPTTLRVDPDYDETVGPFVTHSILRSSLNPHDALRDVLERTRVTVARALEHRNVAFEEVLNCTGLGRASAAESPCRIGFALNHAIPGEVRFGATAARPSLVRHATSRHRLMVWADERQKDMTFNWEYRKELYREDTIRGVAGALRHVLLALAEDSRKTLGELCSLEKAERTRILSWSRGPTDQARREPVQRLVAALAKKEATRLAVVDGERRVDYGWLNGEARRLAEVLIERDVRVESPVGVYLDRGVEMIVSALAILYAGGCYVPLDPSLPEQRLEAMIRSSGMRHLIAEGCAVPARASESVELVDFSARPLRDREPVGLPVLVQPRNLAYMLFTSGSTGRPKGVMVEHAALANRIAWMAAAFNIGDHDRVFHKTPVSFDVFLWEIFLPLTVGATVVVAKPGGHRDPTYLSRVIAEQGVSIAHFVPSMLGIFIDQAPAPLGSSLRCLICSGEALATELCERAAQWLGGTQVLANLYGPTEAAIDVTAWVRDARAPRSRVSIGRPILNLSTYLLDENLALVPPGVVGELYIGGVGVARGYVGSPEQTAERFIPDPFAAGARLYRTGDRARWTADGMISFLGRTDGQVKLRGMRIEPEEIEAVLLGSGLIDDALVSLRGGDASARLAAHVVPRSAHHPALRRALRIADAAARGADAGELLANATLQSSAGEAQAYSLKADLRAHLASHLPEYMIPGDLILVDHIPTGHSGKKDGRSLPAQDPWCGVGAAATLCGPVEVRLAAVWSRILPGSLPDAGSDFFAAGGDSLSAIRLIAAVQGEFGVRVELLQIRAKPTLRQLAASIGAASPESRPDFVLTPPAQQHEPFAPSEVQRAYAIGRSAAFELGSVSTQGYLEIEVEDLICGQLADALNQLIARHDALRTVLTPQGLLKVLPSVERYEPAITDLRHLDEEQREAAVGATRELMSRGLFDLEQWPLIDVRLSRLTDTVTVVHFRIDALLVDGSSIAILESDLNALYQPGAKAALPELRITARDVALHRASRRESAGYKRARSYWLRRAESLPDAPILPLNHSVQPARHAGFNRRRTVLTADQWSSIRDRARQVGVSPAAVLLTCYAEVIGRWSGSPHFLLNLPVFDRPAIHPDIEAVVGNFTATLLLEVNLDESSFSDQVQRIQQQLWEDLAHTEYDGIEVQRARARRRRRMGDAQLPFVFTGLMASGSAALDSGPKTFDFRRERFGVSSTSQVLIDCLAVDLPAGLAVTWDSVDAAFPEGLLDRMYQSMMSRLQRLAADQSAWHTSLPASTPRWRNPDGALLSAAPARSLIEPLLASAKSGPERIAVVHGEVRLSYGELCELARGAAAQLRQAGVQRGDLVGVYMERGWEQVVAVCAIAFAGAAYVALDATMPAERLRRMGESAGVTVLLTQPQRAATTPLPAATLISIQRDGPRAGVNVALPHAQDLAYVMFTSGSTGVPKGVAMSHGAAMNTIDDINHRFSLTAADTVLAVSALGFDLSVFDIFGPLAVGGRVVILDAARALEPAHWRELIARDGVTVWNSTPSLAAHLLDAMTGEPACEGVRLVLLSGDWIPLTLPARLERHMPRAAKVSLGGATEAGIWSIYFPIHRVAPEWKSIPYGKPLSGQDVWVLNERLDHCPEWVAGEIHIAGASLANGYWNDPGHTAERFFIHPQWGVRLYRTGDLGRYLPDGNIEFLGRQDGQVKVRGVRIELGEIESYLEACDGVAGAVVVPERVNGRDVDRLVAYVALDPRNPSAGRSRAEAADRFDQTWASIEAVARQPAGSADEVSSTALADALDGLEAQYRNSVAELIGSLQACRVGARLALDDVLIAEAFAPRYRRWLSRAFAYFTARGCLRRVTQDVYEVIEQPSRNGDSAVPLAEILREDLHSAQIYDSVATISGYQSHYRQCHQAMARVVGAIASVRRCAGGLKVLEVGAGYGSATEHLVPLLQAEDEYVFTDVSSFFSSRANERFAAFAPLRYAHLDINLSPQLQGYARHHYDMVIAASVLHNARDLPRTLRHLKAALAPGGVLVLIEETKFFPFFDLGMGLQQGFNDHDDALRKDHPLLAEGQWHGAFAAAGYARSVSIGSPGSVEAALGFRVLAAQADRTVTELDSERLSKRLERVVPRVAVPACWTQLDELPLTVSGKVDRRRLAESVLSLSLAAPPYREPDTPTERTLAKIWEDAMGVSRIGVDDDFFVLGGDSLVASRVIADSRSAFGAQLPLKAIFEAPTVKTFAALIDLCQPARSGQPGGALAGQPL
jgi:amino acid adenylation domain-containing protein